MNDHLDVLVANINQPMKKICHNSDFVVAVGHNTCFYQREQLPQLAQNSIYLQWLPITNKIELMKNQIGEQKIQLIFFPMEMIKTNLSLLLGVHHAMMLIHFVV